MFVLYFQVVRNILASEPRVTRFKINWEETTSQDAASSSETNNTNGTLVENETANHSIEVPALNENSNSWATMECS